MVSRDTEHLEYPLRAGTSGGPEDLSWTSWRSLDGCYRQRADRLVKHNLPDKH